MTNMRAGSASHANLDLPGYSGPPCFHATTTSLEIRDSTRTTSSLSSASDTARRFAAVHWWSLGRLQLFEAREAIAGAAPSSRIAHQNAVRLELADIAEGGVG